MRFANAMINTTIINILNSDNSHIAKINTQYRQIMTITTNKIWKFKAMNKIPIVTNYTFFAVFAFNKVNSSTKIGFIITEDS